MPTPTDMLTDRGQCLLPLFAHRGVSLACLGELLRLGVGEAEIVAAFRAETGVRLDAWPHRPRPHGG